MKRKFLAGIVAVGFLFVAGCAADNQNGQANVDGQAAVLTSEPKPKPPAPPTPPTSPVSTTSKIGAAPLFLDYTLARYNSLKGKQPVVLFFYSSTHALSKQLDASIRANLPTFPRGTQILRVNFEKEGGLLKTFAVTAKGTIVVLDKTGKISAKLVTPTMAQMLAAVKKVFI